MIEPVIPLRALEHHAYCPRQAAIIHVDGVWMDNAHTVRGVRGHRRVDSAPSRLERGRRVLRGIELWSERYGLTGRADAVEVLLCGSVEPVEYKHGTRHGRNAEIQLCAQSLCLEEMLGIAVPVGHVWYSGLKRRHRIELDAGLRTVTEQTIDAVRSAFSSDRLPGAANDTRCDECQVRPYCLPDLVAAPSRIVGYLEREVLACV